MMTIEEQLDKYGFVVHLVKGDSMMPMLDQDRDTVSITAVAKEKRGGLKKYDLPLYRRPSGQYVLHRILAVKKGYYIIRGDNRILAEKVPYEWILGVTEGYYKGEKYISSDDSEYLAYVKRVCRFWRIKSVIPAFRATCGCIYREIAPQSQKRS